MLAGEVEERHGHQALEDAHDGGCAHTVILAAAAQARNEFKDRRRFEPFKMRASGQPDL